MELNKLADIISLPSRSSYFLSKNLSSLYPLSSLFPSFQLSSIINDVVKDNKSMNPTNISIHYRGDEFIEPKNLQNSTILPLFYTANGIIKIPTKVEYALHRFTPKELLKAIHPNIEVAIEMCLLFITNLSYQYGLSHGKTKGPRWKQLKAEYLRKFFSNSPSNYKNIRTALEYNLRNGPILMCDKTSKKGIKSYGYRLGNSYFGKGIVAYRLKTKECNHLLNKQTKRLLQNAWNNPICSNLIEFYSLITFPSLEDVKMEGKRLVKEKRLSKKGKRFVSLNKHSRDYFKGQNLSFIEDGIKRFKSLTEKGLLIPRPGNGSSGGRVIDSISLMPAWIRNLIKVNGRSLIECDYSCLHPNLAINIYGGNTGFITHEGLSDRLGLDLRTIKTQHLSFFNKKVKHMEASPLFKIYKNDEPQLMRRVIDEKYKSKYRHKATSRNLFDKEVNLMKDVIVQLNKEGIFVGYIFDALLCEAQHAMRVIEIMNNTALAIKVLTQAKCTFEPKKVA